MVLMRGSIRVLGLVSTMILARLLTPEDFGLVAVAMALFAMVELFGDFGFDTVLIQKQDARDEHYDTAWTFNLAFGCIACLTLLAAAPYIGAFYDDDRLFGVLMLVSGFFVVNGLRNVGVVEFRKNMTFDKEFKLQILPRIIGFCVTIPLAFVLKNYWALLFGTLAVNVSYMLATYLMHPYRPKPTLRAWRDLFDFSKWLMFNNFVYYLNWRTPELFIGKLLSLGSAGLFTIADEIARMPTMEISATINRAAFPGYSKAAADPDALKQLYERVMSGIALIVYPAAIGLMLVAEYAVPVLLGEKWLDAVELVEVLSLAGLLIALNTNTGYVFLALGQPRVLSIVGVLRFAVLVPLLVLGCIFGGLLWGAYAILAVAGLVFVGLNVLITTRLRVQFRAILGVHRKPLLATGIMGAALVFLKHEFFAVDVSQTLALTVAVPAGAVVYGAGVLGLWLASGRPDGPEEFVFERLNRLMR